MELKVNHKRASRVMRKFDIKPPRRKARGHFTTISSNNHNYTNLIKELIPDRPGFIFVSDLTYIKFQGRFVYLATVEDIFTREVLSMGVSSRHDSKLALSTVGRATTHHKPEIFHSDQGTEFMAQTVTGYLESHNIKISVSDKASPWQSGYKGSFFGRFKEEFGDFNRFETTGELIAEIYRKIHYYNHKRIYTALKIPPAVFRQTL